MRAERIDVLNFSAGGIPEVKGAIIEKYQAEQDLSYNPEQVLVSNGGKHALHSIFQAVLDPGDEVVIPSPYWLSYPVGFRSF